MRSLSSCATVARSLVVGALALAGTALAQPPAPGPTRLLEVRVLPDGEHYVLLRDFVYDVPGSGLRVRVPRGFVTDFASIPPPLQSLVGRTGRHTAAAVVHDYLYWTQGCASRAEADRVMDLVMKDYDVDRWMRSKIMTGLRVGGWIGWKENASDRRDGYTRTLPDDPTHAHFNGVWTVLRDTLRHRSESLPPLPPGLCGASS